MKFPLIMLNTELRFHNCHKNCVYFTQKLLSFPVQQYARQSERRTHDLKPEDNTKYVQ